MAIQLPAEEQAERKQYFDEKLNQPKDIQVNISLAMAQEIVARLSEVMHQAEYWDTQMYYMALLGQLREQFPKQAFPVTYNE